MVLASTSTTALLVTSTFCKERQHCISKPPGTPKAQPGPQDNAYPALQFLPACLGALLRAALRAEGRLLRVACYPSTI